MTWGEHNFSRTRRGTGESDRAFDIGFYDNEGSSLRGYRLNAPHILHHFLRLLSVYVGIEEEITRVLHLINQASDFVLLGLI